MAWKYGRFPLAVLRMDHHASSSFHSHEFVELVIIESGQGIHFTKNESYPIAAGDVFVIRPYHPHGYSNAHDVRLVNVLFDPDRLALPLHELTRLQGYHALFETKGRARKFYGLTSHLRLDLRRLTQVEGLIAALEADLENKAPGFSFIAKALFMQTIYMLSRCYANQQSLTDRPLQRISQAIAYLEANYTRQIRLSDLTATTHMSLSNLYRDFRAATGFSPNEYLIRLRVMRGAQLLRQGQWNVTETAFQTGFNDGNYFSRQFRQVMGISPRRFVACHGNADVIAEGTE